MKNKKSIQGKRISREKAYEGLGDPRTWEADAKQLEKESRCKHPDHKVPLRIDIPHKKSYRHVCPGCGREILVKTTYEN